MKSAETPNLTLRISPETREMIKELAEANGRSITKEIEQLIKSAHKKISPK